MKHVIIIGAGGHGREVADILHAQADREGGPVLRGFIDDDPDLHGQEVDGVPVLGDWSWLERNDTTDLGVICAIGDPAIRKHLVQRAAAMGLPFARAISPDAYISPHACVEEGVMVFPGAFVSTRTMLGPHCILNAGVSVSHDTKVGSYVTLNPGARLAGAVCIEEGVYIGMGAQVIQERRVGAWSIVGAGAVVIQDLPGHITAVGIPATVMDARKDKK
jgi:sugar O-acyltransferase (sialic acid O-acetyltransferase NeuD family)